MAHDMRALMLACTRRAGVWCVVRRRMWLGAPGPLMQDTWPWPPHAHAHARRKRESEKERERGSLHWPLCTRLHDSYALYIASVCRSSLRLHAAKCRTYTYSIHTWMHARSPLRVPYIHTPRHIHVHIHVHTYYLHTHLHTTYTPTWIYSPFL